LFPIIPGGIATAAPTPAARSATFPIIPGGIATRRPGRSRGRGGRFPIIPGGIATRWRVETRRHTPGSRSSLEGSQRDLDCALGHEITVPDHPWRDRNMISWRHWV